MPKMINRSVLNASTMDILNVIRTNASYEYQKLVPEVQTENDIPAVGAVIYGNGSIANEFVNALVNRIAMVAIRSATFNNPYKRLKKGYLEFGSNIENVFVEIVKALDFSPEKAEKRELKRYLPQVHSVFHVKNWNVLYPISIEDEELKKAFLSVDGVSDMIARIVDSVYTAAEYDEYLLTKYIIIQACTAGQMYMQAVDLSDFDNAAINFRAMSNKLRFISNNYNEAGVPNNAPVERQLIFMDSDFNAKFDVKTLSAAFNRQDADFIGSLYLADSFSTFDNERFAAIQEESTQLPPITDTQLTLMQNVKALLIDEEWFQIYDLLDKMTNTYVSSGDRWNYFYHVEKIISHSPYHCAVAFVDSSATTTVPASFTVKLGRILNIGDVSDLTDTDTAILTMTPITQASLQPQTVRFSQDNDDQIAAAVAVSPEGSVFLGKTALAAIAGGTLTDLTVTAYINDTAYVSDTVTLNEGEADEADLDILDMDNITGNIGTWTFTKVPLI